MQGWTLTQLLRSFAFNQSGDWVSDNISFQVGKLFSQEGVKLDGFIDSGSHGVDDDRFMLG